MMTGMDNEQEDPGVVNPAFVKGEDGGDGEAVEPPKRESKRVAEDGRSEGDGSSGAETDSICSIESNGSTRFHLKMSPRPIRRSQRTLSRHSPVSCRSSYRSHRSSVSSVRKGILKKTNSSTTINMEMNNINQPETPTENGTSRFTDGDDISNGDASRYARSADNIHLNHQRSFNRVKFILDSGRPDNVTGDYDDIKMEKIDRGIDRYDRGKLKDDSDSATLSTSSKKCLFMSAALLTLTMVVILGTFFGSRKKTISESTIYIENALVGHFKITESKFLDSLHDYASSDFKRMSKELETSMLKAIFDAPFDERANSSVVLRIIKFENGSIVPHFRMNWSHKDKLQITVIKSKILRHLNVFGRLGKYRVESPSFFISEVEDACRKTPPHCSHDCTFSNETLRFTCNCPDQLTLDNKNQCVKRDDTKQTLPLPELVGKLLSETDAKKLLVINAEIKEPSSSTEPPRPAQPEKELSKAPEDKIENRDSSKLPEVVKDPISDMATKPLIVTSPEPKKSPSSTEPPPPPQPEKEPSKIPEGKAEDSDTSKDENERISSNEREESAQEAIEIKKTGDPTSPPTEKTVDDSTKKIVVESTTIKVEKVESTTKKEIAKVEEITPSKEEKKDGSDLLFNQTDDQENVNNEEKSEVTPHIEKEAKTKDAVPETTKDGEPMEEEKPSVPVREDLEKDSKDIHTTKPSVEESTSKHELSTTRSNSTLGATTSTPTPTSLDKAIFSNEPTTTTASYKSSTSMSREVVIEPTIEEVDNTVGSDSKETNSTIAVKVTLSMPSNSSMERVNIEDATSETSEIKVSNQKPKTVLELLINKTIGLTEVSEKTPTAVESSIELLEETLKALNESSDTTILKESSQKPILTATFQQHLNNGESSTISIKMSPHFVENTTFSQLSLSSTTESSIASTLNLTASTSTSTSVPSTSQTTKEKSISLQDITTTEQTTNYTLIPPHSHSESSTSTTISLPTSIQMSVDGKVIDTTNLTLTYNKTTIHVTQSEKIADISPIMSEVTNDSEGTTESRASSSVSSMPSFVNNSTQISLPANISMIPVMNASDTTTQSTTKMNSTVPGTIITEPPQDQNFSKVNYTSSNQDNLTQSSIPDSTTIMDTSKSSTHITTIMVVTVPVSQPSSPTTPTTPLSQHPDFHIGMIASISDELSSSHGTQDQKHMDEVIPLKNCSLDEFRCVDSSENPLIVCIPKDRRCDSVFDCPDHSDEDQCIKNNCMGNYQCWTGECIRREFVCDGIQHCSHGSEIRNDEVCDTWSCSDEDFECNAGGGRVCIPLSRKCDGHSDCFNHTDEVGCSTECPREHFLCPEGWCIPKLWQCDGHPDCYGGEDEKECGCEGLDQSRCFVGGCVPSFKLCDGLRDCIDGSDEWGCLRIDNSTNLLEVRSELSRWSTVCEDHWTERWSDRVCEQLGYGSILPTEKVQMTEEKLSPRVALTPEASNSSKKGRAPLQYFLTLKEECDSDRLVGISCQKPACGSWTFNGTKVNHQSPAPLDEAWPSFGLLKLREKQVVDSTCAATLITPLWILTSYSCLLSKSGGLDPVSWAFMIGEISPDAANENTQIRYPKQVVFHPGAKKNSSLWEKDAALLMLDSPITLTKSVKLICLADKPIQNDNRCKVVTWAKSHPHSGREIQISQNLPRPNLSLNSCNLHYYGGTLLENGHLCASFQQEPKSPCTGKEGSPLMCQDSESRNTWYIHGILSLTGNCASFNNPSVFTDLLTIRPWIQNVIGKNPGGLKETLARIKHTSTTTMEPTSTTSVPSSDSSKNLSAIHDLAPSANEHSGANLNQGLPQDDITES